jgi:dUTP pyrophosphatase
MRNLEVKVLENGFGLPLPKYETEGAAGLDLFAATKENKKILIAPNSAEMIPTGIAISVPSGYEAQIRPRSGLAAKNGITVLNSPGTIDSDYRGEILVMLINHSKKDFEVVRGMRIAQMVISKIEQFNLISVDELNTTDRGKDGFGSTGISTRKDEE